MRVRPFQKDGADLISLHLLLFLIHLKLGTERHRDTPNLTFYHFSADAFDSPLLQKWPFVLLSTPNILTHVITSVLEESMDP